MVLIEVIVFSINLKIQVLRIFFPVPKRSLLSITPLLEPSTDPITLVGVTVELPTVEANRSNERKLQRYKNCTRAAILEFPPDGFTRNERRHGWVALHILLSCYCFWLLAIVCDDYFVPAMESMCKSKRNAAGN